MKYFSAFLLIAAYVAANDWGEKVTYEIPAGLLEKNTKSADTAQVNSPVDTNQIWKGKIQTNYDITVDTADKETVLELYWTRQQTLTGASAWSSDAIEDLMCVEDWMGVKTTVNCFVTMYTILDEDTYEAYTMGLSGFPSYPTISNDSTALNSQVNAECLGKETCKHHYTCDFRQPNETGVTAANRFEAVKDDYPVPCSLVVGITD